MTLERRLAALEAVAPPEPMTVKINFLLPEDNSQPAEAVCYATGIRVTRQAGETNEQMIARLPVSPNRVRIVLLAPLEH